MLLRLLDILELPNLLLQLVVGASRLRVEHLVDHIVHLLPQLSFNQFSIDKRVKLRFLCEIASLEIELCLDLQHIFQLVLNLGHLL